jgi:hypothetical protein
MSEETYENIEQMDMTEKWVYLIEHILVIILFTSLLVLIIANIFQIIIGQKKWKTTPLLLFYALAFISIICRELDILLYWLEYSIYAFTVFI